VDFQRDEFYNEDIQEQPPVSFGLTASATATATANETNRYIDKTDEIRFTKILTKYSTEYNNQIFYTVFVKDGDG
jgi:hypothetical protein